MTSTHGQDEGKELLEAVALAQRALEQLGEAVRETAGRVLEYDEVVALVGLLDPLARQQRVVSDLVDVPKADVEKRPEIELPPSATRDWVDEEPSARIQPESAPGSYRTGGGIGDL